MVALLLPLLGAGCANDYPPELVPPVANRVSAPELYQPSIEANYPLQVGDSLLINSYFDPALKQPVVIQTDGKISLLLVGTIMAAGKTAKELSDELTAGYRRYLDHRDITVTVTDAVGMAVYVGGEVRAPAMLPIRGDLTLMQAITAAGGFLPTANKRQILILRPSATGRFQTFQKDVEAVLRNEDGEFYLHRRDIVFTPKTDIAKVDQFVDQYINQVVPRAVTTVFGYQFFNQTNSNSTSVAGH